MDLIDELGNEIAFAVLVNKQHREKIDSKEVLPLIGRLRDALELISSKDHMLPESERVNTASTF